MEVDSRFYFLIPSSWFILSQCWSKDIRIKTVFDSKDVHLYIQNNNITARFSAKNRDYTSSNLRELHCLMIPGSLVFVPLLLGSKVLAGRSTSSNRFGLFISGFLGTDPFRKGSKDLQLNVKDVYRIWGRLWVGVVEGCEFLGKPFDIIRVVPPYTQYLSWLCLSVCLSVCSRV